MIADDEVRAAQREMQDKITRDGGAELPALFDLQGNMLPAKWVRGRFGMTFAILADDDPDGKVVAWFSPSKARNPEVRHRHDAAKGYFVGAVLVPNVAASIGHAGSGRSGTVTTYVYIRRLDGGFSRDVKIINDGLGELI